MNKEKSMLKTKQDITIPGQPCFTIKQLLGANSDKVEITLRVKFRSLIEKGEYVELGTLPAVKGRPEKIYCSSPVTKQILEDARKKDASLLHESPESYNKAGKPGSKKDIGEPTKLPLFKRLDLPSKETIAMFTRKPVTVLAVK